MEKLLALDIGERRIGVAISDALGMLAHPFTTLEWKGIKHLISDLQQIIDQQQIAKVIVGVPYTMKGSLSKKTEEITAIIAELKVALKIEIREVDERLTTKMAHDALHASGKKPSKQRQRVDQIAAVYILQSYLDMKS